MWTTADPQDFGISTLSIASLNCRLRKQLQLLQLQQDSPTSSVAVQERKWPIITIWKGNKLWLIYSPLHICIPWEYQIIQGWKKTFLPREVLAGTASLLIQNDTHERTTVSIQGMYVWIVKYPIRLLRSKNIVIII